MAHVQLSEQSPFNLHTGSQYRAKLFPHIDTASLPQHKTTIFFLLSQLQTFIHQRDVPFFVGDFRAYSILPGPLQEGNHQADLLTKPKVFSAMEKARVSHSLHHQNASALRLQLKISREAARAMVQDCGHCPIHLPNLPNGVNPWGLRPNDLWQMDFSHIPSFGKLCYVHVCVDTFLHVIITSACTGEAIKDAIQHMFLCFSHLGIPRAIKTDNIPAYTSGAFKKFNKTFQIAHTMAIPYRGRP